MHRSLALLLLTVATASAAVLDVWPNWRGPANGVSNLRTLPSSWSGDRNVAWRADVPGRGHSSPVVWGDYVFLSTDVEGDVIPGAAPAKHTLEGQPFVHPDSVGGTHKHTLKVLAYNTTSGKLLWERTAYEGKVFDDTHRFNTYASPTPVADGKFVYVWFDSQGLYKYDFDGNLVWSASLGGIATLGVGYGGSPILFEDLILLLCDQDEGEHSFLAAVSTSDGKIAWKLARKNQITWTTPALVEVRGRKQLIVPSTEDVAAYDPRTGKELWHAEGLGGNVVHTPVVGHGMVFVSTGYPNKKTIAVRLDPAPGEARVAWKYEKGTGYIPSPILYGDYLYLLTGAGLLTCLDAHTGEPKYEGKRFPAPSQFVASPVAFDGKVLISSQDGDTYVVKAGPEHEMLGTNPLGEQMFASLALVGDSIYIRGEKHLYRIRNSPKL
jgi:outer membrane protein assembly factor BamB